MYIAGWGAVIVAYVVVAGLFYGYATLSAVPDPSSENRQRRWWTWRV